MLNKIILLAIATLSASAWAEVTNSLTTGVDYSSGKYGGTSSTDILYVPVTGKMQFDYLYLKLTVPYISITSAGDAVVRGMGRVRTTNTSTKTTTQSGLGDVVAAAGYTVVETDALMLDLVGKIKFGTADAAKNLGTGENDYSAQLDAFYTLNKTTLFATAGYKVVGAPAGITVNNVVYGTVGASKKLNDKNSAGVMLDAAQASTALGSDTAELSVFISNKISSSLKAQVSLLKGFSDGSPDYGGSIMLTGTL